MVKWRLKALHTIQIMSYKTDEYHRCRKNVNLKRSKALKPPTERFIHLEQLKPPQIERTIMRIMAIMIPRTISFIFIFWNHIFLLSLVPCCLKSCACKIIYELKVTKMIANNLEYFHKSKNKTETSIFGDLSDLYHERSLQVQCDPDSVFKGKETKKNNTMFEIY